MKMRFWRRWLNTGRNLTGKEGSQQHSSGERGQEDTEISMCEQIRWEEVVDILKSLNGGKAPGPDRILNEVIMYVSGRMVEVLVDMLNLVLRSECCLEDRIRSLVVPLYKDGDAEVIGNYRGVSLDCCVAKVSTRLLIWRLGKFCKEKVFKEAHGSFRSKRRCTDQLFILTGLCECAIWKREGRCCYILF